MNNKKRRKKIFASYLSKVEPLVEEPIVKATHPCPCCGYITMPGISPTAYICPVCFWEIDDFIDSDDDPSDSNHGISLNIARKNYQSYGAMSQHLIKYCRSATLEEQP